LSARIAFGRAICCDLAAAERREWLVTNGIGGFASGTIAGTLTRRYHGLLIAALQPPVARRLLVTKVEETVRYRGGAYELFANRWKDDYVAPCGFLSIERFELDGTEPVWHYAVADALIEKRVWMSHGDNATFVRYRVLRAAAPVYLVLRAFVNDRDFHGNTHAVTQGMDVRLNGTSTLAVGNQVTIAADRGTAAVENVWYRDFVLSQETARGLDDRDDNLSAGTLSVTLNADESVTLSLECTPSFAGAALGAINAKDVLAAWDATPHAAQAPSWMRQCVLAADQFVVKRALPNDPDGRSIIAGYHWFGDWGRDTMIALPGLTLTTGRPEIAKRILVAFAAFIDGGMLPNNFPEGSASPEYNTVDAALWYVEAAAQYVDATADFQTLRALWPALRSIVERYRDGTRYNIHMDADGLISAGVPGMQLTWMDAKVGDWVVSPRIGKPVEIGALWYNALERMARFAASLGEPSDAYRELAAMARCGFERFWNAPAESCYDVLDGPNGNDATLRPNQIFAVSLPNSPLSAQRQRAIVDACAVQLLTSYGLRTLPTTDPRFCARYAGSPRERDAAYHEGTVWPWLLGPFALAYARVYGDRATARAFLEPLADQLFDAGLGCIGEIADATAPFTPRGAIAQAWSVAELLRAYVALS
jgi:predicted glycogen debranching enzyme